MSFRNLILFQITSRTGNTLQYGAAMKLQSSDDAKKLNSVKITITKRTKEKTLAADDEEEVLEKVVGYEGELEVFYASKEALKDVLGYELDSNNNLVQVENSKTKKDFGIFFVSEDARGNVYQKYLHDITFKSPKEEDYTTDSGDGVATIKIPFTGRLMKLSDGKLSSGVTVYEDNTGYKSDENPTSMYNITVAPN